MIDSNPAQVALAMLCEGFAVKADNMPQARIRLLTQALGAIPVPLLEPMVMRAIGTRRPRYGDLPTVGELRDDAEACRLEAIRGLGPYEGCVSCVGGWRTVQHETRGACVVRCACWQARRQKLAALGVGERLALAEGDEA